MKDFTEEKRRWREENYPVGKMLGYPECCIEEFCSLPPELLKVMTVRPIDRIKLNAALVRGVFTGFIPCAKHAIEIRDGKRTLASLIEPGGLSTIK